MDSWGGSGSIFAEAQLDGGGCYDPFANMWGNLSDNNFWGGGSSSNCYNARNCFDQAFDCLVLVGAVVTIFIQLATCPGTLGATCILALLVHPAAAGAASKCSTAVTECEKPTCPTP